MTEDQPAYLYRAGNTPLVIGMPHAGRGIPADIAAGMTAAALEQPDTALHVERLMEFAGRYGAAAIASTQCRYVIDLNRSPDGLNRHAGVNNTTLCSTERFDHAPIYRPGREPQAEEVARRLALYWRPYHDRLAAELARMRAKHGVAILLDIHTIPARVARFYDTESPPLSLKSGARTRAAPGLVDALQAVLERQSTFPFEVDGRFKGGFIVQTYGAPEKNVHSLQLEISQATYLDDDGRYDEVGAARLQSLLEELVRTCLDWAAANAEKRS